MDWIKQNKFLTGFLAVIIVVGGGLGFLAFTAKGKYEEAFSTYQSKQQELNGLQTKQPFPDDANVAKMQQLQKDHQAAIDSLQQDLVKAQIPLKPLSPEKFQDSLRESVRRVTAKAAERSVKLPEQGFYMGFDAYQGTPPKPEAAPLLGRMLEAMEVAVTTLLDSNISTLTTIKRDNLPEEGLPSNTPPPPTTRSGQRAERDDEKPKGGELVQRHSFEVGFTAPEPALRSFLNSLIASKQQFLVPNAITVANEQDKGPSKSESAQPAAVPPPVPPDQGAQPADPNVPPIPPTATAARQFILGMEKLNVTAKIDIVNFAEPAPAKK